MEERTEKIIADYLQDPHDNACRQALEEAGQNGELHNSQVADLQQFYARLETLPLPEPGPDLRSDFYQMLAREKQKHQAATSWWQQLNTLFASWLQVLPLGRMAYTGVVLALGAFLGFWYQQHQSADSEKLSALTAEMKQMKQMMMLTLLEQPSTTDRLKAVNLTTDMATANNQVIRALLQTLNTDPSVNVRLAAIEALHQHAGNPLAREGLVQSISRQESPLVQLALADIMLAMQEKGSVKSLQQLLKKRNLNEAVKTRVEQTIRVLI
ncbi:MAG: HEAT repeat domain-containing protein [Adhaeribacter sp.]